MVPVNSSNIWSEFIVLRFTIQLFEYIIDKGASPPVFLLTLMVQLFYDFGFSVLEGDTEPLYTSSIIYILSDSSKCVHKDLGLNLNPITMGLFAQPFGTQFRIILFSSPSGIFLEL